MSFGFSFGKYLRENTSHLTVLRFWVVTPCRLVGSYKRFGEPLVSTFSETLISTDESTRRHNPEQCHLHRRENLKSNTVTCFTPLILYRNRIIIFLYGNKISEKQFCFRAMKSRNVIDENADVQTNSTVSYEKYQAADCMLGHELNGTRGRSDAVWYRHLVCA
jgi:hypothetical protein